MNTQKKILIVEDEPIIADDLAYIICNFGYEIIGTTMSVAEALAIIDVKKPDLVLLDIALKGDDDGIDLANLLNEKYNIPFLFLTSNADQLTINRVKKTQPAGFILKPFREKELKTQIAIALYDNTIVNPKENKLTKEQIFVKVGTDMIGVKTAEILYAKADDNYTFIYTDSHEYCVSLNLKNFISKLDSNYFLRVHRSYLVNLKRINRLSDGYVFVNNKKVPVGRAYTKELKQKIQII